jgi:predicted ThiF/HesA family dinucleotide-utilizing enzyme
MGAAADVRDHLLGEVRGVHRDGVVISDTVASARVEERDVVHRAQRLGAQVGQRAQPLPAAGREHHGREHVRESAACCSRRGTSTR